MRPEDEDHITATRLTLARDTMAPNLPKLKPGDVVAGRFRIVEIIGSGGFSVVYRAHQEDANRFVALKVLKPQASSDTKIVERFRREAYFASHLTHANTISLFDYGHTDDGLCYIAMEYLNGTDLSAVVQTHKPMDLSRVWKILVQSCRSLAEAHRLGLVHRDLKPENIFLTTREDREFVKVLDFGVSKAISNFGDAGPNTMRPLTQEGTVFGTPLYMAPEQAMAEEITPAVDIYALGHIAFEMITGHAAYERCTNAMDVMLRQINDPPLALPAPWNTTPFSDLITACTQKDPVHRLSSASVLLDILLGPEFDPWADPLEKPARAPRTLSLEAIVAIDSDDLLSDEDLAQTFRWELDTLEAAYLECVTQKAPRLVIIRGAPGTRRAGLLRAFLSKVRRDRSGQVLHRSASAESSDSSLECELSVLTGKHLKGSGIGEVKRLLSELYGEDSELAFSAEQLSRESRPLNTLGAIRETLLARVSGPFHAAAQSQPLIWGIENLERLDTLTLTFLERFFRDLQISHSPVLIIATLDPDQLDRRAGMARFVEALMHVGRPIARQLQLINPEEESDNLATRRIMAVPENIPLYGASDSDDEEEPLTQRLELEEESPSTAFDRILGYLAQLGDDVPLDLWKLVYARILDTDLIRLVDMVLHQAEKFGILQISPESIRFTKPGFAEALRARFEELDESMISHKKLGELMSQFYPTPTHSQMKVIAQHFRLGGQPERANELLFRAGENAFQALDLDGAREFFLAVQKSLDLTHTGVTPSLVSLRLGEIHGALGEHGAAEDALHRALETADVNDREGQGRINKLLGDLAASQSRYSEALRFYEKSREAFRVMGQTRSFISVTNEMGRCALLQDRAGLAEDLSRQALEMSQKLKDPLLIARVHRQLGQVLVRRGRFAEAGEHLDQALPVFERHGRETEFVECLNELGNVMYADGRSADSLLYFGRAISLASSLHLSQQHDAHLGLARAQAALGQLEQADMTLTETLNGVRASQDRQRLAEVLLHLGDVRFAERQFDSAKQCYSRVIELAEEIGLRRIWVSSMARLAYLALELKDESEIFRTLGRALQRCEQMQYKEGELQIRTHIIYVQLLLYGFPPTGDTFSGLISSETDGPTRASTLAYLFRADVAAARGEYANALGFLRYAHVGASQVGDFALYLPISRRVYLIKKAMQQPIDPAAAKGWGLGAMIPPEIGVRRFEQLPHAG